MPGFEHYKRTFMHPNGRCYNIRKYAYACKVFDPFVLCEKSISALELMIDDLTFFGYDSYFTQTFLANMKVELPKAKEHVRQAFDWDEIPGSEQYNICMENKERIERDKNLQK